MWLGGWKYKYAKMLLMDIEGISTYHPRVHDLTAQASSCLPSPHSMPHSRTAVLGSIKASSGVAEGDAEWVHQCGGLVSVSDVPSH